MRLFVFDHFCYGLCARTEIIVQSILKLNGLVLLIRRSRDVSVSVVVLFSRCLATIKICGEMSTRNQKEGKKYSDSDRIPRPA